MSQKEKIITVLNEEIRVTKEDYISLTDMLRSKDGEFFISDWLRNRNTLEYLGIWERVHNRDFNWDEFALIKSQAGLNSYKISIKEWVAKTHAIGIQAKAGRYGGTYAHPDIAFEFGMWISAEFKIYLVKEFQDAYASEADLLNMALFGTTAKQWREQNPNQEGNMRDYANVAQLVCLANLETLNAHFIQQALPQSQRLQLLNNTAIQQMHLLTDDRSIKQLQGGKV
jgi:hypothetical protein